MKLEQSSSSPHPGCRGKPCPHITRHGEVLPMRSFTSSGLKAVRRTRRGACIVTRKGCLRPALPSVAKKRTEPKEEIKFDPSQDRIFKHRNVRTLQKLCLFCEVVSDNPAVLLNTST